MQKPAYLNYLTKTELEDRVKQAYHHLSICDVCALRCPVDRYSGQMGACRTGIFARVSSYGPHMGEESPLRGWRGSGTIFFSNCNLRCQYCQNHEISQSSSGQEVESQEIAAMMLELQSYGCHNINLVSPSHVVPQILAAILIASQAGLRLPIVYNTGGYDSHEMLKLLDGVIDIYMPDMKYADPKIAQRYSKIPNYPAVNQAALREMHRQVGDLQIDDRSLAFRGLLVRHLLLPNNLAGTDKILEFIAQEISKDTYLNLMDQYHPDFKASYYPELNRPISIQEYDTAVQKALQIGFHRLDQKSTFRR
jgi:putative pyruvate formate lyase activating enzyme